MTRFYGRRGVVADNRYTKSCIRKYTVGRMGIYTLYPVRGISLEWQQSLDILRTPDLFY